MGKKICSFFGHRDAPDSIADALELQIKKSIEENHGEMTFYVGGYGAFDRMAAATVRKIKKNYPDVELVLIIAYLPTGQVREYGKEYDATIYPSGLETVPQKFAITHRNRWIVNNSDVLITYIHHHGGAAAAVKYAKTRNVSINNI